MSMARPSASVNVCWRVDRERTLAPRPQARYDALAKQYEAEKRDHNGTKAQLAARDGELAAANRTIAELKAMVVQLRTELKQEQDARHVAAGLASDLQAQGNNAEAKLQVRCWAGVAGSQRRWNVGKPCADVVPTAMHCYV